MCILWFVGILHYCFRLYFCNFGLTLSVRVGFVCTYKTIQRNNSGIMFAFTIIFRNNLNNDANNRTVIWEETNNNARFLFNILAPQQTKHNRIPYSPIINIRCKSPRFCTDCHGILFLVSLSIYLKVYIK